MNDSDIEQATQAGGMLEGVDILEENEVDKDDDDLICLTALYGEDYYFKTDDISILSWLEENDSLARVNWRKNETYKRTNKQFI